MGEGESREEPRSVKEKRMPIDLPPEEEKEQSPELTEEEKIRQDLGNFLMTYELLGDWATDGKPIFFPKGNENDIEQKVGSKEDQIEIDEEVKADIKINRWSLKHRFRRHLVTKKEKDKDKSKEYDRILSEISEEPRIQRLLDRLSPDVLEETGLGQFSKN